MVCMKKQKQIKTDLVKMENFLDYEKNIEVENETFKKLMLIYSFAIKELETKIDIINQEYKNFYEYNLIDHINTRIKKPESIIKKMKDRQIDITYKNMINNINDIAGIRIICPLRKDIFSIKDIILNIPGINVIKQKDYVTNPKKTGYSSYHLIAEVPVTLSKNIIYVKVEIQIRTITMDFWAEIEHKMKYKTDKDIDKSYSKEWINCAKLIGKLDNKMMLLNS